jgi:hypothetical protein
MPICNFGETPTCYLWLTRASSPLAPAQHYPCSTVASPTADWQGDSGQRMRDGQQNHSWTSSWPGILLHAPQHGVSGVTTVAMRPLRRSHAAPGISDVEVASCTQSSQTPCRVIDGDEFIACLHDGCSLKSCPRRRVYDMSNGAALMVEEISSHHSPAAA